MGVGCVSPPLKADSQREHNMGATVHAEGFLAVERLAPRRINRASMLGVSASFIGLYSFCSEPNPQVTIENYKLFILVDVRKDVAIS